jgi:hypothetical protein
LVLVKSMQSAETVAGGGLGVERGFPENAPAAVPTSLRSNKSASW